MNYYLGLDIGTTGAKAILINSSGEVISSATSEYLMYNPKPLWSEQNPEDWWKATQNSIKDIFKKSGIKNSEVKGMGLTGQMHGLVLLDKDGEVLRPCIMWNDQRTIKECEEITSLFGFDNLLRITGNPVLPGFTAPKILWVKKNETQVYKKIEHILLPKDYIRFCLTGEFATDVSDASGTSLLNVGKRNWADEILSVLDIQKAWMPEVYESIEITGKIKKSAAEKTGLNYETPIVAGGGDQAAGGIGTGTVKDGITSVVLGTSGVVFSHTNNLTIEPEGKLHAFCHAVPGAWHVMGVTLSAAGSLKWYKEIFGETEKQIAAEKNINVYDLLTKLAGEIPAGSEGLIFLPYLTGERTPYPDPDAKGTFTGITIRHNKKHFIRSILEGVAYSLKDCLELNKRLGLGISEIRISGGGAKSKLWRQILTNVFNTEIVTLITTEGAPYGAALLAAVGTGEYSSVEEVCEKTIKISESTKPAADNVKLYEEYYDIYKNLYQSLKGSFNKISSAVEKQFRQ
ncbi:MAG: xylulokinase [Ignavibacteria bacterium RBG_16_34_14]|nr:MAG: xylulokinase [Ignavibacteria bacterium RBG_16_34_14]